MLRDYRGVYKYVAISIVGLSSLMTLPAASAKEEREPSLKLKAFYELAWQRQPEYKSYQHRVDAAIAKQKVASNFLANPASVEISHKTDRANSNLGASETSIGLGFPLWLWNERSSSINLADAEYKKLLSQYFLSQLKVAAEVREAYWSYQKSKLESDLASSRYENAKSLSVDVDKRFKVGDLSKADLYQANAALANAEASFAEAQANLISAEQRVKTLIGRDSAVKINLERFSNNLEVMPEIPENLTSLDVNLPIVTAFIDQLEVAKKAFDLAKSQTRASPELQILTNKDRGAYGAPYQQSITVGIRIPFGSSAQNTNRVASASAEMIDSETRLIYERESAISNVESNIAIVKASKIKLEAAEKRSMLANETRKFFDKSFRYGETDLPTRLRIELESVDAGKQALIAKIAYASAISNLRQSLGLLPE